MLRASIVVLGFGEVRYSMSKSDDSVKLFVNGELAGSVLSSRGRMVSSGEVVLRKSYQTIPRYTYKSTVILVTKTGFLTKSQCAR